MNDLDHPNADITNKAKDTNEKLNQLLMTSNANYSQIGRRLSKADMTKKHQMSSTYVYNRVKTTSKSSERKSTVQSGRKHR